MAHLLQRLKISNHGWLNLVKDFCRLFRRAASTPTKLTQEAPAESTAGPEASAPATPCSRQSNLRQASDSLNATVTLATPSTLLPCSTSCRPKRLNVSRMPVQELLANSVDGRFVEDQLRMPRHSGSICGTVSVCGHEKLRMRVIHFNKGIITRSTAR